MNKTEFFLAKFFSVLFHPLLMPTYGLILFFFLPFYEAQRLSLYNQRVLTLFVFTLTAVFPALFVYLLKRTHMVSTLQLANKEERNLPMLFTTVFYFMCYFLLKGLGLPLIYLALFFSSASVVLLSFIVNFFWKISTHMLALGGLTAYFLTIGYLFQIPVFPVVGLILLMAGLTGFSRLVLQAHTPAQVYTGFAAGFFTMPLFMILTAYF